MQTKYVNLPFMLRILYIVTLTLFLIFTQIPPVTGKSAEGIPVTSDKTGITILEDRKYFEVLLKRIDDADKDIIISMYIFKTTGKKVNSAIKVRDALINASGRGVVIKVLLEREDEKGSSLNYENEYTAKKLVNGGAAVYFESPGKRTHVKAVVIDGKYAFIGSHNLTASALQHNNELSLMIDSEEIAGEIASYIEELLKKSDNWKR